MKYLLLVLILFSKANAIDGIDDNFLAKVSSGDLTSLNEAFVQRAHADGAQAEDLDIAIGKSITKNPKSFLIALKGHEVDLISLSMLIRSLGEDYVDLPEKAKHEVELRIKAINSVHDKELQEVAKRCLVELNIKLKEFNNEATKAGSVEKVSCMFPNRQNKMIIESCAIKMSNDSFEVDRFVFGIIQFDKDGLAGGSIGESGCYWLNNKGVLRKTHCFDNGADYFQDGLVRYINSDGLFGYMDKKLKIRISAKYTFAFPFEHGYARVCNGCRAENVDSEHKVQLGGHWMIINKRGKMVTDCPKAQEYHECRLKNK